MHGCVCGRVVLGRVCPDCGRTGGTPPAALLLLGLTACASPSELLEQVFPDDTPAGPVDQGNADELLMDEPAYGIPAQPVLPNPPVRRVQPEPVRTPDAGTPSEPMRPVPQPAYGVGATAPNPRTKAKTKAKKPAPPPPKFDPEPQPLYGVP